jgi:type IV secretory pathway VirB2 component (pilin)
VLGKYDRFLMKHFFKILFLFSVLFVADASYSQAVVNPNQLQNQNQIQNPWWNQDAVLNQPSSAGGGGASSGGLPPCVTTPNQIVSPQDAVALVGSCLPQNLEVNNTTYFRLCEIRRFFCGTVKTVMIAASIFIMGLLILTGKAKWTHALILTTGIVVFAGAEWITIQLTTFPPNFGVVWSCFCIDTWSDIVNNFTGLFSF